MNPNAVALAAVLVPHGFHYDSEDDWLENDTYLLKFTGSKVSICTPIWHTKHNKVIVYDLSDPDSIQKILKEVDCE